MEIQLGRSTGLKTRGDGKFSIGSGFATDYKENFFDANGYDDMEAVAKKNMLLTISSMNADASLEAMNSLATKKVKTSSRDMLLQLGNLT